MFISMSLFCDYIYLLLFLMTFGWFKTLCLKLNSTDSMMDKHLELKVTFTMTTYNLHILGGILFDIF
jgi:hypothetical protein